VICCQAAIQLGRCLRRNYIDYAAAFQQQESGVFVTLLHLPRGGQAYDAGDDGNEVIFHSGIELTCLQARIHFIFGVLSMSIRILNYFQEKNRMT